MKKFRKLLPALSMLLISALLMGSSTFAWFSMNTTVTATGMSVTAEAPTSLLISTKSATDGFGSTATLENSNDSASAKFSPVSYSGVCNKWFGLTSEAMTLVNEKGKLQGVTAVDDGSAETAFTSLKFNTDKAVYKESHDFYHDTVWLKVDGKENKDVKATLAYETDTTANTIKNAMHVVFVVGGNVVSTIDMGGEDAALTTVNLATLTANAAGTQIEIYYFLSGNDDDCKNANISADATMSIKITFDAVSVGV